MLDTSSLDARLEEIRREAGQVREVYFWFTPEGSANSRLRDDGQFGVIAISQDLRAYPVALCESREEAEAVARYAMAYFERHGDRHAEAARA
ncbi:hypothetical protein E1B22_03745 [Thermaerobacter sp. FW80]|uniref:hypothetical protein n=1 Tax=Thermaerobacter sp. FW80 TaxID=2546351 RepID=UPI001074B8B8|nr:hypothetical protein [Thermaerobacter sp. FW80]QBS37110.1 hypothetical protein E1B22_03745 [Thermaerobacter sp. FW80]